jgi:hypothetical protein
MEPLGFSLALSATRTHVLSARPDAPVVPERPPRARPVANGSRRLAAGVLRRLADRVEPACPHPSPAH